MPSAPLSLGNSRIALVTDDPDFPVDGAVARALEGVGDFLAEAGAKVDRAARPGFTSWECYETYLALLRGATSVRSSSEEYAQNLADAERLDPNDRCYRALMLRGLTMSHHRWHHHNHRRYAMTAQWEALFADQEFLLCPVASTPAFPLVADTPKHARRVLVNGSELPSANDLFLAGARLRELSAGHHRSGRHRRGRPADRHADHRPVRP